MQNYLNNNINWNNKLLLKFCFQEATSTSGSVLRHDFWSYLICNNIKQFYGREMGKSGTKYETLFMKLKVFWRVVIRGIFRNAWKIVNVINFHWPLIFFPPDEPTLPSQINKQQLNGIFNYLTFPYFAVLPCCNFCVVPYNIYYIDSRTL